MPVSENCNIWITCESVSSIDFPWVFFFLVCCCLGFLSVFYFVLFSVLWSCFLICLIILYLNVWEILSVYNSTENFFSFSWKTENWEIILIQVRWVYFWFPLVPVLGPPGVPSENYSSLPAPHTHTSSWIPT